MSGPTLLFIQGRLREGGEEDYQRYLAGTGPLMKEYGAIVEAVGGGIDSEVATDLWPVNAVLRFPDLEAAEGFLSDPRYLAIKRRYRDAAYEELHLSLVAARAPRNSPRQVAEAAFETFRASLASGEWEPFLALLSDDFTFSFPTGPFRGEHRGKERARDFFRYVSEAFPGGLHIREVTGVTAEGTRVVFEFRDEGELRGEPYRNRVAISLDVRGDQICGYREYFGLIGEPASGRAP